MNVVVVYGDDKGKINVTKEELEKMLNEAYSKGYDKGYSEGKASSWISVGGIGTTTPYYGPITGDHVTISCNGSGS